tara:strand:+ start:633 stop:893 length:261 start_codon:yes stop_codon:yes gene_type:complete
MSAFRRRKIDKDPTSVNTEVGRKEVHLLRKSVDGSKRKQGYGIWGCWWVGACGWVGLGRDRGLLLTEYGFWARYWRRTGGIGEDRR